MFIERTRTALGELMGRRLDDVRLAVMMLDGLEIADRTHVVALGITTEGVKIPLGLWEGFDRERDARATLLADLVDRGLDPEQAILFVIDGAKALRKAIKDVFGEHALVHRCHRHKERNVTDLLPERDRAADPRPDPRRVGADRPSPRRERLELLASELERTWPDAAGSLREGIDDTLTLMRLGITGQLAKTLSSTNPCEIMIEIVRYTQRNVKRWQRRRHAQALDRRRHARRRAAVPTDHRLPRPRQARDRDRTSHHPHRQRTTTTIRRLASPLPSDRQPRGPPPKFHDDGLRAVLNTRVEVLGVALGGVLHGLGDLRHNFLCLLCSVLRHLFAVFERLAAGLLGLVLDLIGDRSQTLVLNVG